LPRSTELDLLLDLSPPVRLDLWALLFSCGVAAGTAAPRFAPALVLAALAVAGGAALWEGIVPEGWRPMALLAPLFVAAGWGVAALHASSPDPLADFAAIEPDGVTVLGRVASPPVRGGFGYRADVRVERLWYGGREVLRGGGVEVFAGDLSAGVGDRVRLTGSLSPPQGGGGGFDYGRYLSTKGISAVLEARSVRLVEGGGWVGEVHRRAREALGYGLAPREAAVVQGMVLGDESLIPEDTRQDFRRSGIAHVIAISGQHVAVITAALYVLLRLIGLPLTARGPAALALVWLYIVVAGAPPSAVRAGVVSGFVLLAPAFGRRLSPLHFMGAMLALVLAFSPRLLYSVGFQLSVAAVGGILLLRGPFSRLLSPAFRGRVRWVREALVVSLAAQVATAPILAASFGQVSVAGVLANLLAVPLSGPILVLGMLGALLGSFLPPLAYPVNAANGFLVVLLEHVAGGFSALPFAAVATSGVGAVMEALLYAGCLPAALSGALDAGRQRLWGAVALLWSALWIGLLGWAAG